MMTGMAEFLLSIGSGRFDGKKPIQAGRS